VNIVPEPSMESCQKRFVHRLNLRFTVWNSFSLYCLI